MKKYPDLFDRQCAFTPFSITQVGWASNFSNNVTIAFRTLRCFGFRIACWQTVGPA